VLEGVCAKTVRLVCSVTPRVLFVMAALHTTHDQLHFAKLLLQFARLAL